MRAVLDPNVLISAVLAPNGSPTRVLRSWLDGAYELIVSELLVGELERAFGYPKLRKRVDEAEVVELVALLRRQAHVFDDPGNAPETRSPDPGDDYLLALAAVARAVLVSGDMHLLGLAGHLPVYSPAAFLELLEVRS